MIEPFEFHEIDENDKIFIDYPTLKINKSPAFYLILRGIVGNIKIKQTFRNEIISQEFNFINPAERSSIFVENSVKTVEELNVGLLGLLEVLKTKCKSNLEILPKYISDSFTLKDLEEVLSNKKLISKNKVFFNSLNNEFSNFYYHTSVNNHTLAFLHLYRILEYVSYSFPVIYSTSSKDFANSFDLLKSLFTGDKDKGELKVFKDFIEVVLSLEKDYKRLTIDINIVSDLDEYNRRIYDTIYRICDKEIFAEFGNVKNSKLCIKFPEFSSFIITIRNRFFHLKNSQNSNIHSVDIVDSDYFFSLINNKCAYFLSLITLVVIKKSYFEN
jgi:hypothetical protein